MCAAYFSPHYDFLYIKNILATLVHKRTEALALEEVL